MTTQEVTIKINMSCQNILARVMRENILLAEIVLLGDEDTFRVKPGRSRPAPVPYMDHPGASAHSDRRHDEQERHNALGNSKPSKR